MTDIHLKLIDIDSKSVFLLSLRYFWSINLKQNSHEYLIKNRPKITYAHYQNEAWTNSIICLPRKPNGII